MESETTSQQNNENKEISNIENNEINPETSNNNKNLNEPSNKLTLSESQPNSETDLINFKTEEQLKVDEKEKKENEEVIYSNSDKDKEKETEKKSFFQKILSQFKAGTMVNSIFNISIISLGSGVFAIPLKVQYMTLVFTPVYVILAGIANLFSLLMISYVVDKTNILDFFQVTYKILGKTYARILNIVIIAYTYGLIILFQVIVYKLLGGIINDIGDYKYESLNDFVEKSFWRKYSYKFIVCYGICLIILLPFCLKKNIGEMKAPTYIGVISLMFVILIIIIQSPYFINHYQDEIYKKDDKSTHLNVYDLSKGADKDLNIIRPFVTLFFAYTSQNALFPIIEALKDRTKKNN